MKGSSFGAIYDTFDGFERQMEDALDSIFNEDVPPGVTAVAASVTQSFQSIIGLLIYIYGALCELRFSWRNSHSMHRTSYTRSKCRTIIHMCHGMF